MEVIEVVEREVEVIEVIERGPIGQTGPQPDINYTVVSSARTLEAADLIAADTSGGAFTLTLPLNPSNGDAVDIFDFSEAFDTNPLTIARNGSRIESLEENLVCNVEGAYFTLIYTGSTRGWQVLPRYGTSGGGGENALTTQGDMLYRGAAVNTRLPIGSAGQILKVNSGATAPEWGAAPATGVTSVSGTTPIVSSGGATPTISISAATTGAAGSMSSADKTKLDAITGTNTGDQTITLTGNVTGSGTGSFAATIANDAVDNAKLSNMAQSTLKGRATASTGDPEDLSASQVRTILNVADGAEVNVQANWTEASSGSDAFIQNKPTLGGAAALNVGTTAGTVAAGDDARLSDSRTPTSHTHGNLTNDGKVGSTSGLPLVTTTAGAVTTLALGTANQVLRTKSDLSGVEFADPSGGGVTGAAASASDVLGVSGANITGVDAGSDKIVFWDDSASELTYLTVGSGLSLTDTTLTATATGGGSTNLWIPASQWIPRTTNGCGVDSRETSTNLQNFDELLFDAGTDEFAQALVEMPSNYNNGTITARFYWTASSGSGAVIWGIQGRAFADDDALDTTAGSPQTVTDTLLAANDMHISAATSAVTIGGTPAANTPIQFQIYRDADPAGDTLGVDARLLGVEIIFN